MKSGRKNKHAKKRKVSIPSSREIHKILNQPAKKKLPGLGINVVIKHPYESSLRTYIHYLNELRVEKVRLEFNYYEPISDHIMEVFVHELQRSGIKVLGLLTGLVPGNFVNCMMPTLRFKCPLDTLDDYKAYVEKYVSTFKGIIKDWEIWNEPNTLRFWIHNPDPSEYTRLVKESAPIIKKIDKENKVYFGGLMGDDLKVIAPFQKINYIRECIEQGIDQYIDVYNFHPYEPFCYFSRKPADYYLPALTNTISNFREKYRDIKKPFVISEIGVCPLWVKISQKEIAKLYKDLYLLSKKRNMDCYFWVLSDFYGPEYSRFNPETAFGFIDWHLDEKELFTAFIDETKDL